MFNNGSKIIYKENLFSESAMASHKSVGLEFFKKNRPDQSAGDKIIFISLVAMVVFQSEDLKTYVLADGLHEKNMICSDDFDDANPKEKRRDVIGSLSIGEVYHFHGLRYTCRDGFLWVRFLILESEELIYLFSRFQKILLLKKLTKLSWRILVELKPEQTLSIPKT